MNEPKVSVVMPVYNGEKYLSLAIESILHQDFRDFEFLIVNDGSTDNSGSIVRSFSDPRIRLINNEQNMGVIASLNKAFGLAKGEYIARMDHDDICMKNRLAVQVKFMDAHPEIAASGSFYYMMRGDKKALADFPLTHEEICCYMVFNSPIPHPSAIIRVSTLKKHGLTYRAEYQHAEDYDFWSNLSHYSRLANIPDILLKYRVHPTQVTNNPVFVPARDRTVNAVRGRHLRLMGVEPDEKEAKLHNIIGDGTAPANKQELDDAEKWLVKLIRVNNENGKLDKSSFDRIVLERWLRICFNFYGGGKGLRYFYTSSLNGMIKLPLKTKFAFIHNIYYSWKRLKIK